MHQVLPALAILVPTPVYAAQVDDRAAVKIAEPKELIVSKDIGRSRLRRMNHAVDAFYGVNRWSRRQHKSY